MDQNHTAQPGHNETPWRIQVRQGVTGWATLFQIFGFLLGKNIVTIHEHFPRIITTKNQ